MITVIYIKRDGVGGRIEVNGSKHACDGTRSLSYKLASCTVRVGPLSKNSDRPALFGSCVAGRSRRIASYMSACVGDLS